MSTLKQISAEVGVHVVVLIKEAHLISACLTSADTYPSLGGSLVPSREVFSQGLVSAVASVVLGSAHSEDRSFHPFVLADVN